MINLFQFSILDYIQHFANVSHIHANVIFFTVSLCPIDVDTCTEKQPPTIRIAVT